MMLVGNRRLEITSAMLLAVAFNLGYWRGSKRVLTGDKIDSSLKHTWST